jgi:DNA-binding MarR family transcriptional regulator
MIRNRSSVKQRPGLLLQPHVISQLVGTVVQRVVEGSEVTAAEFAVTSWLNVVGSATPSALADQLGMSATTLSAMIERLVQKGQVRRVRHPEDGRSYLLELTRRGQATNTRNGARLATQLKALRANLDGDPEEVLAALDLLEGALRKTISGT